MLQPMARAQDPAPAPDKMPAASTQVFVPLKLNIVVSKYQAEKKLSSLPYSISLNSTNTPARIRMVAEVPVPTITASEGKPVQSYSYRDVGLSIDARAVYQAPNLFRVEVTVEDTSISTPSQVQGAPSITGIPIFKTFRASNTVMLRDGQSTQLMSAGDPIGGETMRVDMTLNVVK
jgi:hypothetical protein